MSFALVTVLSQGHDTQNPEFKGEVILPHIFSLYSAVSKVECHAEEDHGGKAAHVICLGNRRGAFE